MNEAYLDTIFDRVIHSKMRKDNGYKYSDLGYYILKEIIENHENASLKDLVQDHIYQDLGASFTSYHPLEKFDINTIVPTENDTYFRNQLLRGMYTIQELPCKMVLADMQVYFPMPTIWQS